MERREFIALLGVAAAAMPQAARADSSSRPSADSFAGRIAGTWRFASSVNTRRDGTTFDRWGWNPKGVLMFDNLGHYSQIIVGSESRVFGAKTFCAFGTYTVDETKKLLITNIEACSAPRLNGVVQTRDIVRLTVDELKYLNPITSTGSMAEVVWKRLT